MNERITEQELLSRIGEKLDKILDNAETTQVIYSIAWDIHETIIDRQKMNYADGVSENRKPE